MSFAVAFRCCSHTRIIDNSTSLEPLDRDVRSQLGLDLLGELQLRRNVEATEMLAEYESNGGADTFHAWLQSARQKVKSDFNTM